MLDVETQIPTQIPSPNATLTPSQLPTRIATADWKTYTNTKHGFEIKYPGTWKVLKSNSKELVISRLQNVITVSVLDFRFSAAKFQDWINERPYALTKFDDRDALRWHERRTPGRTADIIFGAEHFLIPTANLEWAVGIDLSMEDVEAWSDCIKIFNQIADSLVFGGAN